MKLKLRLATLPFLLHLVVIIILLNFPTSCGKSLSPNTKEIQNDKNDGNNELEKHLKNNFVHNNLLSDLARISSDEAVGKKQSNIVNEKGAISMKNSDDNASPNQRKTKAKVSTPVIRTPAKVASLTDDKTSSAAGKNDKISLVKFTKPKNNESNKHQTSRFSKFTTPNNDVPDIERSNDDDVNKSHRIPSVVSDRNDRHPYKKKDNIKFSHSATSSHQEESGKDRNKPEMKNSSSKEKDEPPEVRSNNILKSYENDASDHVVVCAGEKKTIACPDNALINITNAIYGYDGESGCSIENSPFCQAKGVHEVVRSACQNQTSCLLQSSGQEFEGMCPGKNNFLKVGYVCEKQPSSFTSSNLNSKEAITSWPASSIESMQQSLYQPIKDSYSSYQSSPYIPHPLKSQPISYHNYAHNPMNTIGYGDYNQQQKSMSYNTGLMNDKVTWPMANPYNTYFENQNYKPFQPMEPKMPASSNYYFDSGIRMPLGNQQQKFRPYATQELFQYQQPFDSYKINNNKQQNYPGYQDYSYQYNNLGKNYYTNNNPKKYADTKYSQQQASSKSRASTSFHYPRNSYTGSCYACPSCQDCSTKSYCQGCPSCKKLSCDEKPKKEAKYLDSIDSLIEEFGKKTKDMSPMEMSAVVISPVPKNFQIKHSLPLEDPSFRPEDDNDDKDDEYTEIDEEKDVVDKKVDDDDENDESELTLADGENSRHETQNQEEHKKTAVFKPIEFASEINKFKHKKNDKKTKKMKKKSRKKSKAIYDDDDDEDGYDYKVYEDLLKKPNKNRVKHQKKRNQKHKHKKSRKNNVKRELHNNGHAEEVIAEVNNSDQEISYLKPVFYDTSKWW